MKLLTALIKLLSKPEVVIVTQPVQEGSDPTTLLPELRETWGQALGKEFVKVDQFPIVPDNYALMIGDAKTVVNDASYPYSSMMGPVLPDNIYNWFTATGSFPGYQALAVLSQQWLVDKACSMPPDDAARNGYEISLPKYPGDSKECVETLASCDKKFKILEQLKEAGRFCNIFGIRLCIFEVESEDREYYEKPFNIDGVTKGSYRGLSQVDAQWVMPVLSQTGSSDPAAQRFYEPEFWVISGRKYHHSHVVILRGPQPPDILKPTYIFGGISLTQRIYEHVYDAERTAAEAPRLAMSKRTSSMKVDLAKVGMKQGAFEQRLMQWINYRDNFSVKVLGKDEELTETDTSLADLDEVIMTQYQLVAAIAKVPATKLLGTSPKGFSSTGEFEMLNYHEELESIHDKWFNPILEKHYKLLTKSTYGELIEVDIAWNPVNSMTAKELAEINKTRMETGTALINAGVIAPDEERDRIRSDPKSGYVLDTDETEPAAPALEPEAPPPPEQPIKGPEAPEKTSLPHSEQPASGEPSNDAEAPEAERSAIDIPKADQFVTRLSELLSRVIEEGMAPEAERTPSDFNSGLTGEQFETPSPPVGAAKDLQLFIKTMPAEMREVISKLKLPTEERGAVENVRSDAPVDIQSPASEKPTVAPIQPSVKPSVKASVKPSVTSELSGDAAPGVHASVHGNIAPGVSSLIPIEQAHKILNLRGYTLEIETPQGHTRQGYDLNGNPFSITMPYDYGFIHGIDGEDGDELDIFIGPDPENGKIFVITQNNPVSGEFDEFKVMLGFENATVATDAYHSAFSNDWTGFGGIQEVTLDNLKPIV